MKPRTTDEVTALFDCKSDSFDPCTYHIKKYHRHFLISYSVWTICLL